MESQEWLAPVVGVLLVAAGLAMADPRAPRVLLGVTGGAWLLGALSPWLLLAHQGVLLVTLLAGETGRLTGWRRYFALSAIPIALGMLAQPVVGLLLAAAGALPFARRRTPITVGLAAAGALVGATLVGGWLVSRLDPDGFVPSTALLAYEGSLVMAAGTLVLGSRTQQTRDRGLVDRLVAGAETVGIAGLAGVLSEVLRAPGLTILQPPPDPVPTSDLAVSVDGTVLVAVRHPVVEALDRATREDIAAAVRLVLLADEHRRVLDEQAAAVVAAQQRLVVAQDAQRSAMAARLRQDVMAPLHAASDVLAGVATPGDTVAAAAVDVARNQITAATADLDDLVQGAIPAELGAGGIVAALRAMADSSPVGVDLRIDDDVAASRAVEATLWFVCAEALVNVLRHARTTSATVALSRADDLVRLVVSDDGVGGAEPGRPGLAGLADRVAVLGGRLTLSSPPGGGTRLVAELPSAAATDPPAATAPDRGGATRRR